MNKPHGLQRGAGPRSRSHQRGPQAYSWAVDEVAEPLVGSGLS